MSPLYSHSRLSSFENCPKQFQFRYVLKIPSETEEARKVLDELLGKLGENDWGEEHTFGIHLATEEALMNAIKHGNQRDPEKSVFVAFRVSGSMLQLEIGIRMKSPFC